MSASTPATDRAMIARVAAYVKWASCEDRTAATAAARKAFADRFAQQVDPDGKLSPAERAKRAEAAKRAYFQRLALRSARVRRARAAAKKAEGSAAA